MVSKFSDLPRWVRDFVPLLCVMALIFWFSAQSTLIDIESQTEERLFYKTAHALAYATLAWLWWRALSPRRRVTWLLLGLACALSILYGISDEFHQLFVPGRHGQLADVLFDTSGALAMILLIRRWHWLRTFPENIPLFSTKPDSRQSHWKGIESK